MFFSEGPRKTPSRRKLHRVPEADRTRRIMRDAELPADRQEALTAPRCSRTRGTGFHDPFPEPRTDHDAAQVQDRPVGLPCFPLAGQGTPRRVTPPSPPARPTPRPPT